MNNLFKHFDKVKNIGFSFKGEQEFHSKRKTDKERKDRIKIIKAYRKDELKNKIDGDHRILQIFTIMSIFEHQFENREEYSYMCVGDEDGAIFYFEESDLELL